MATRRSPSAAWAKRRCSSHPERHRTSPKSSTVFLRRRPCGQTVKRFHEYVLDVARYGNVRPASQVFSGDVAGLVRSLKKETELFVEHIWSTKQGLTGLLTSSETFVDGTLASIYGLSGSFGDGFVQVSLDSTKRRGVFGQLGFLAVNATSQDPDPIHRGAFLTRRVACNTVSAPPANIPPLPPPSPNMTNRQRVEAHTQAPGTACAACHTYAINPFGFAFESFDAVGRYRTTDNGQPVVTSGQPLLDGDAVSVRDAVDLAEKLAASPAAHECYAKSWTAYLLGRPTMDEDIDAHRWLAAASLKNESVKELLLRLATSDAFTRRSAEEMP